MSKTGGIKGDVKMGKRLREGTEPEGERGGKNEGERVHEKPYDLGTL